jgi:5'-nucleotidase
VPAIALSQVYVVRGMIPWATAEAFAAGAIRRIVAAALPWPKDTLFNVNFPAVPPEMVRGLAITCQGKRIVGDNLTEGIDPRERPYYWIGPAKPTGGVTAGSDLAALEASRVSITPIHVNLTNVPVVEALRRDFE